MSGEVLKRKPRTPGPPTGWPLLPVPEEGTLRYPTLESSVRQLIKIVLLTRPGEQLMRPRFGAGLSQFLHQANTLDTRQEIQDAVTEAVTRSERRVRLERVEVWEDEEPNTVRIEIAYRVRRTGELVQTMVRMNLGS